jgi:mannosyl-3-phosphoglycerate phosphatase
LHLTPKRNIYACSGKDSTLLQAFAQQAEVITSKSRPIVFTDLDGTLLDHHTYSFAPAKTTLAELANRQIPVIPTTSKTFAEVLVLRQQAGLFGPFITENGAAVFLPQNQWPEQPEGTKAYQGYWLKSFAKPRQHWLNLLADITGEHQSHYLGFSQMSTEQISAATGLTLESAHLANARLFSEPLQWLGTEAQKQRFKQKMQAAGAFVLQGGRFVHISDHCNKGLALAWLHQLYQAKQQEIYTIALGDSYNDIDMLETADIAVQIKTAKHPYPKLKRSHNVWQSKHEGPYGWAECLTQILQLK